MGPRRHSFCLGLEGQKARDFLPTLVSGIPHRADQGLAREPRVPPVLVHSRGETRKVSFIVISAMALVTEGPTPGG